jgi:LysR family transcriptional regulator, nod-box dependent transcriptional activator
MRFNKLDLNLLVALDAMLKLRSISRAAEQLHLSQSAMSNALGRLRDYFDDELLSQVGRQMKLTPRAEVLKEAVQDLLLRLDTTITAQPEFDPSTSDREFRILASDFTSIVLMPHLLRLAAGSTVRFRFAPLVDDPQRVLERGEADLLVIPREYCSPDHPTASLFRERFVCVAWRDSRHARAALTMEGYLRAGHVAMQPPTGPQQSLETTFMQRMGIARRVEVTTFSFAAAAHLVVGTERLATLHTRLARQYAAWLPLVLLEPPMAIDEMDQVVQWHKYRSQDPGLHWLRDLLHQAVEKMDADEAAAGLPSPGAQPRPGPRADGPAA